MPVTASSLASRHSLVIFACSNLVKIIFKGIREVSGSSDRSVKAACPTVVGP